MSDNTGPDDRLTADVCMCVHLSGTIDLTIIHVQTRAHLNTSIHTHTAAAAPDKVSVVQIVTPPPSSVPRDQDNNKLSTGALVKAHLRL